MLWVELAYPAVVLSALSVDLSADSRKYLLSVERKIEGASRTPHGAPLVLGSTRDRRRDDPLVAGQSRPVGLTLRRSAQDRRPS